MSKSTTFLLPFVGYILDGRDHGDAWKGVRYIFGFIFIFILLCISIRILGMWTVVLFPFLFIVALLLRKYIVKERSTGPLDSGSDDI